MCVWLVFGFTADSICLRVWLCVNGFLRARIAYTVCIYTLHIQGCVQCLGKRLKTFRFDEELYGKFKCVCSSGDVGVTCAFERFMGGCVAEGRLVFPQKAAANYAVEARILVDWLSKGKLFYRGESGEEITIQGRLLWLLPKIANSGLKREIEDALKKSVKA